MRTRNGWYWSGDLGYVDADGWLWFAGRDYDWLRVDGENFAAAPVERIVGRFPGVVLGAVYAVPAVDVGDEVMVALQLEPGVEFDPRAFDEFLAAQADLGVKWSPRYVRIAAQLPVTATTQDPEARACAPSGGSAPTRSGGDPSAGAPLRRLTPDDGAVDPRRRSPTAATRSVSSTRAEACRGGRGRRA